MGMFDFIKAAGQAIGIGGGDPPEADALKDQLAELGLESSGLDVQVEGDTVVVKGEAASQEAKEKLILALGNVKGIAKVEEGITTPAPQPEAVFYTVVRGDTLSGVAKAQYGNANAYMKIFEANKPMLAHPDKIYPGQVLRIPQDG